MTCRATYFLLLCLIVPVNTLAQRSAVSAKEVTGTFRRDYKGFSFYGEIRLIALGDNKLYVEFDFVRPKREDDAHFGRAGGLATIEGDSAIFREVNGYDSSLCRIVIKFSRPGELVIADEFGRWDSCGFGYGVSGDGTYKKISSKRPEFERPENIPERAVVSDKEVTGTFRLKSDDRDNTVRIQAMGNNTLQVELQIATDMRKGATEEQWLLGVATIEGDRAVFRAQHEGKECSLKMKFTKESELLISDQVEDFCYFGGGVYVFGTYKKISSKSPGFSR